MCYSLTDVVIPVRRSLQNRDSPALSSSQIYIIICSGRNGIGELKIATGFSDHLHQSLLKVFHKLRDFRMYGYEGPHPDLWDGNEAFKGDSRAGNTFYMEKQAALRQSINLITSPKMIQLRLLCEQHELCHIHTVRPFHSAIILFLITFSFRSFTLASSPAPPPPP